MTVVVHKIRPIGGALCGNADGIVAERLMSGARWCEQCVNLMSVYDRDALTENERRARDGKCEGAPDGIHAWLSTGGELEVCPHCDSEAIATPIGIVEWSRRNRLAHQEKDDGKRTDWREISRFDFDNAVPLREEDKNNEKRLALQGFIDGVSHRAVFVGNMKHWRLVTLFPETGSPFDYRGGAACQNCRYYQPDNTTGLVLWGIEEGFCAHPSLGDDKSTTAKDWCEMHEWNQFTSLEYPAFYTIIMSRDLFDYTNFGINHRIGGMTNIALQIENPDMEPVVEAFVKQSMDAAKDAGLDGRMLITRCMKRGINMVPQRQWIAIPPIHS